MSQMFDADLLATFLAVVKHRGFTAAAKAINSTQPTVSMQVNRLEQQAGHRLLERNKRGLISLTREGEVVERMALEITHLQEITRRRLNETLVSGTVRIAMSDDFASGRGLTTLLGDFIKVHPSVCLEATIGNGPELLKSLEAGLFDYTLCKMEGTLATNATELWRESLVWVSDTDFLENTSAEIRLVTFSPPCIYRSRAIEVLKRQGYNWRVIYVTPSLTGIRAAVTAGLGVCLLPLSLVTDDLRIVPDNMLPSGGVISFGFHRRHGIEDAASLMLGDMLLKLRSSFQIVKPHLNARATMSTPF